MARSWVGLTILACLPCMVTLRSREASNSYMNSQNTEECYESAVVSSTIASEPRLLPALVHKAEFAYEWPRFLRGRPRYCDVAPAAGPRDRRCAAVCPTLPRGHHVSIAGRTVSYRVL